MLPMVLPPGASISEWKGPDMVLMDNYTMMVLLDKAVSLPTVQSGGRERCRQLIKSSDK